LLLQQFLALVDVAGPTKAPSTKNNAFSPVADSSLIRSPVSVNLCECVVYHFIAEKSNPKVEIGRPARLRNWI
jgi:hypothetical protein